MIKIVNNNFILYPSLFDDTSFTILLEAYTDIRINNNTIQTADQYEWTFFSVVIFSTQITKPSYLLEFNNNILTNISTPGAILLLDYDILSLQVNMWVNNNIIQNLIGSFVIYYNIPNANNIYNYTEIYNNTHLNIINFMPYISIQCFKEVQMNNNVYTFSFYTQTVNYINNCWNVNIVNESISHILLNSSSNLILLIF